MHVPQVDELIKRKSGPCLRLWSESVPIGWDQIMTGCDWFTHFLILLCHKTISCSKQNFLFSFLLTTVTWTHIFWNVKKYDDILINPWIICLSFLFEHYVNTNTGWWEIFLSVNIQTDKIDDICINQIDLSLSCITCLSLFQILLLNNS